MNSSVPSTRLDEIHHNVFNPLSCIQALCLESENKDQINIQISRIVEYLRSLGITEQELKMIKVIEDQRNIISTLRDRLYKGTRK